MGLTAKETIESIANYSNATIEQKLSLVPTVNRLEKVLWEGAQSLENFGTEPIIVTSSTQKVKSYSIYGVSTSKKITLAEKLSLYDDIEVQMRFTNTDGGQISSQNTARFPVSDFEFDGINCFKWLQFYNENRTGDCVFAIAKISESELGIIWPINTTTNLKMWLTAIRGVKYVNPYAFSTKEQMIGYWIDGKPLYQKSYSLTSPTFTEGGENASLNFEHGIGNISNYHIVDGFYMTGNGVNLNFFYPTTPVEMNIGEVAMFSYATINDKIIIIRHNAEALNGVPLYITLRYTKTTD